jgi:catalase
VEGDVLERAFQYWKNVDAECGKRIEELVRGDADLGGPGGQDDKAREHAQDPVVEKDTHAG